MELRVDGGVGGMAAREPQGGLASPLPPSPSFPPLLLLPLPLPPPLPPPPPSATRPLLPWLYPLSPCRQSTSSQLVPTLTEGAEEKQRDYVPVIVMKDYDTRLPEARVVPVMGDLEWAPNHLVRDLERFGHRGRFALRSDQETALVSLVKEVARLRGRSAAMLGSSVVEDSHENGFMERKECQEH